MKKILILFSLLVANVFAFSQAHFNTVLAGSSTGTAVASAALEVRSTSKGMLTPRMSEAQMLAISSPANALLVYNTTASSFYYYDLPTTTWVQLAAGGSTTGDPATITYFNATGNATGDSTFRTSLSDSISSPTVYLLTDSFKGEFVTNTIRLYNDKGATGLIKFDSATITGGQTFYIPSNAAMNGYILKSNGNVTEWSPPFGSVVGQLLFIGDDSASVICDTAANSVFVDATGTVAIGDVNNESTGTTLTISDSLQIIGARTAGIFKINDTIGTTLFSVDIPSQKTKIVGSLQLQDGTATKFTVDTNGIVTFGSLDSVTAYALTPSNGSKVYCNDCSGNGITGRFISYIGGAWRRESFN